MVQAVKYSSVVCEKLGLNAAIIFHNVCYWCNKNASENRNLKVGLYWTFNSVKAWSDKSKCNFSQAQIKTAFIKLKDAGLIQVGCFNRHLYDRIKWYSVDLGKIELLDPDYTESTLEDFRKKIDPSETILSPHARDEDDLGF